MAVTLSETLFVDDSDCVTDGEEDSDDIREEDCPVDSDAKGEEEDDIDGVLVDTIL